MMLFLTKIIIIMNQQHAFGDFYWDETLNFISNNLSSVSTRLTLQSQVTVYLIGLLTIL